MLCSLLNKNLMSFSVRDVDGPQKSCFQYFLTHHNYHSHQHKEQKTATAKMEFFSFPHYYQG